MSFLTTSVAVPVWLLILLIAGFTPLLFKLYRLAQAFRRGNIIKEEQEDVVVWKIRSSKPTASAKKAISDIARDKRHEEKADIAHVLKIMASQGERGILIRSLADQMQVNLSKAQLAIGKLVDKKLVEEVVGVSGTKYYLTQLGRNYCSSKGFR